MKKKKIEQVDKEQIIALLNDPLVKRYMPLSPEDFDDKQYDQFIAEKKAIWKEFGFGPCAYFIKNKFIGWGGIQPDEGNYELALVLSPRYWGYGRKLYHDLIQEAFTERNLDSVTILFPPSRTRVRWILKQGFVEEARIEIKGEEFIRFRLSNPNLNTINNSANAVVKVSYYQKPPSNIESKMSAGFVEYEKENGIDVNYARFSIVLSDKLENTFAALNAYTAFAEIYIEGIWVNKTHRGKGYGRQLIQLLERKFKGQGFNNINLVTSAFQAPEFYRKCGFTEEFVRENKKNPKLTKYFFVKYFTDEDQYQGIL